ncbi:transcriptional regulator [Sulfolobus acidocaldarius]|uniref:Conserved Crenarchaeal protein n=4 Tax=Sulfolobus acidocaldarius TaxID=2285 RepID=Q4JAS4_SULAC|nr:transcriptional regulator [Sulfolobus acidocaldarius]AAY80105.1 conserved Crenarchaeal protein [Sulfolobus acidocaldarius DSM 639]AGE70678.1 putative transcription elongation factor Elf1 [Sulfolobus acidocaldarius N8]AGE72950.1 putative transcription elongation factor Elf1 [Sulfolobus acidocaldarius Ron12/I]ALU28981.1 transcription elongation factor [Sulfolobus acidocaldarius]ALU31708.1 transcription elongation factor [Sulfolobus acidocaldarius]
MGGRKKRRKLQLQRPKPKIPSVFECPRCGKVTISITVKEGIAKVMCGNCKLEDQFDVPLVYDEANAYGKFIDRYYEGKIEQNLKDTEEKAQDEIQGEGS